MEFSPTVVESIHATIKENEVHLRAKFASCPDPQISWFKDDVEIDLTEQISSKDPHFRFNFQSDKHYYTSILVISNFTEEDFSQYKCKAWNKLGQVFSTYNFSLEGKDFNKSFGKFFELFFVAIAA